MQFPFSGIYSCIQFLLYNRNSWTSFPLAEVKSWFAADWQTAEFFPGKLFAENMFQDNCNCKGALDFGLNKVPLFDFYRARFRSLFTLVTNSLRNV